MHRQSDGRRSTAKKASKHCIHTKLLAVRITAARPAIVEEGLRPQDVRVVLCTVAAGLGAQRPKGIGILVLSRVVLDPRLTDEGGAAEVLRGETAGTHGRGRVGRLLHPRTVHVAAEHHQRGCLAQPSEEGNRPVSDGDVVAVHQPPSPIVEVLQLHVNVQNIDE